MTSTTLAVLDGLADALEKVAAALDAFDRADDQESENNHT